MKIKDRIYQVLLFNDNLAFSFWEVFERLTSKFWLVKYFRLLRALTDLEKRGLIESKHIGKRKYYQIRHSTEEYKKELER